MIKETYPYYLAGKAEQPNTDLEVIDKYSGRVAARSALADAATIDAGIAAAVRAAGPFRNWPVHRRQAVLQHCVDRVRAEAEAWAEVLCVEAGKPIRDSRGEVTRLIDTFRIAAEESVRVTGEVLPLDISARAEGYFGMWKRVPVGPCSFITPFNFPLNLAAHKIAPALAVGCPFVLKPSDKTPLGALLLGEVLAETDLPEGAFSILPCRVEEAGALVTDERIKLLSFTGSTAVGWQLKAQAGKKKVHLELGGNAACIVDQDVDIDDAVARLITGAFYQSGQSCVSVQRIYIHEAIYEAMKRALVQAASGLKSGDPKEEDTFIGPMITEEAAQRVERWIARAVEDGAQRLCGGQRSGSMLEATLLDGVADGDALLCEEAFGPVAVLMPFNDFDDVLDRVNEGPFGLQAGVFTRDIHKAHRAWDRLEVGGVLINETPAWRVDHMPYGGVKDSGMGREGLRFAMQEMSEIRMFVLRSPPPR